MTKNPNFLIEKMSSEIDNMMILFRFQSGVSVLGRNKDCDLVLQGAGVSTSHCSLAYTTGSVTLRYGSSFFLFCT